MEKKKQLSWDALIAAAEAQCLKDVLVSLKVARSAPETPMSLLSRVRLAKALNLDMSQFDLDSAKIARLEVIEAAAAKALGDVFAARVDQGAGSAEGADQESLYARVTKAITNFASTIYNKVDDFAAALWDGAAWIAGMILGFTGDTLCFIGAVVDRIGQGLAPKPEPAPAAA